MEVVYEKKNHFHRFNCIRFCLLDFGFLTIIESLPKVHFKKYNLIDFLRGFFSKKKQIYELFAKINICFDIIIKVEVLCILFGTIP